VESWRREMKTGQKFTIFLRIAGLLLIGGLVIEGITLIWLHPVSFLIHIGIAGLLIAAGTLLYLYTVISHT
jgi:hypothetical protein